MDLPIDFGHDDALCCPVCEGPHLHHVIGGVEEGHGDPRTDNVRIPMWCEVCNACGHDCPYEPSITLVVNHHEGWETIFWDVEEPRDE